MGVSCIVQWVYPDSLNTSQALEALQKKIELLGGTVVGNWSIDCDVLQSSLPPAAGGGGASSQSKFLYFIHSNEYPRTTFSIVDPPFTCLIADNTLDVIFNHLKSFYIHRKQLKVEVRGYRYTVQDKYIIKFGSVTFGTTTKVIIIETESKDDNVISSGWEPVVDITKSLLYSPVHISLPDHLHKSLDGCYTPADSMVQYAHIFIQIRKGNTK
jgi:hypothetical protein